MSDEAQNIPPRTHVSVRSDGRGDKCVVVYEDGALVAAAYRIDDAERSRDYDDLLKAAEDRLRFALIRVQSMRAGRTLMVSAGQLTKGQVMVVSPPDVSGGPNDTF